ncbi:hypothetical protein D0N36_06780 [Hymenobacter lapidiphilus]|uniref:hypothetical protein n=1 Tax=Hymenobacter sp. CCM 8763 TaxID=2303334 RepID=UPI000E357C93|nr:hypothetical protein [Hymenobacter sp. CCM 8763]RFP65902.1 hypothetical protein D0N36_06780 [Hymenobacter sp. CCM 8763]
MQLTTTHTNRINPAELRYLRTALAACTIGCRYSAMQAIVVYAHLHDGLELTDEAAYLTAEMAAAEATSNALHLSATAR